MKVLVFLFCYFFLFSSTLFAESLMIDNHKCDVHWKQNKQKMKVWGRVMGGQKCQQLNLSISLVNSRTSGRAHVEAAIKNYKPKITYNTFKAIDDYVNSKSIHKDRWHVKNIYLSCLE